MQAGLGRSYRYLNESVKPVFAFGAGSSYDGFRLALADVTSGRVWWVCTPVPSLQRTSLPLPANRVSSSALGHAQRKCVEPRRSAVFGRHHGILQATEHGHSPARISAAEGPSQAAALRL